MREELALAILAGLAACASPVAQRTVTVPRQAALPRGGRAGALCRLSTEGLPAVKLVLRADRLEFGAAELARGVSIPYQVTVTQDVVQVVPKTVCGATGPSGLYVFEIQPPRPGFIFGGYPR
jgi:hypothetical protein